MPDQTRTIYGRNGRNSDFVQDDRFINLLKRTGCDQWISSTSHLDSYFVRNNDGVSFGKLSSDEIIRFGIYPVPQTIVDE